MISLQTNEVVGQALETGKAISDYGMMAITAGFFLVLSAILMVTIFRWFMKLINAMMEEQKQTMKQLIEETKTQNVQLADISEGLMPETQLRVKTISAISFDLSMEKVLQIIKRVRRENHIEDREATDAKVRQLLYNLFGDMGSKFDLFTYRGKRLSAYTDAQGWCDILAEVIKSEIYNEKGENDARARTNIEAVFSRIKLDFYHSMAEI